MRIRIPNFRNAAMGRMTDLVFGPKSGFADRVRQSIVRSVLGGMGLSLVTFVGSPFETHRGAVALIYLMIVAVVSLTVDFVSSASIAIAATLCLRYFFAPPPSTPGIDKPLDVAALVTFLATAAIITRLISKMQRLTEELRRREAYLAEAQRLSHTGSFGWGLSTGEILWSEETFRIFQYDRTTKPTVELILERVHPEDVALVKQTIEHAAQDGNDFEHEYRLVMPDGSIKYVHVVAHALSDESDGIEFVGAVMDVTAVKQAEEALRRSESYLAEAQRLTHTGSWAWRVAGGNALHLSEEWYRIYGFDPQEGMPAWEERLQRIHPEDRGQWQEATDRAIGEKSDYEVEVRILLPDGTVKYIHTVGHPVLNASGDVVQFVGSSMDISASKRAEEALRQAQAGLAHVNRVTTMGELTASLAHEVNQPIAAAITNANTCLRWLAADTP